MKMINFFFDFMVFCALLGVSIWMFSENNWLFGSVFLAACGWQGYKLLKRMTSDDSPYI